MIRNIETYFLENFAFWIVSLQKNDIYKATFSVSKQLCNIEIWDT